MRRIGLFDQEVEHPLKMAFWLFISFVVMPIVITFIVMGLTVLANQFRDSPPQDWQEAPYPYAQTR